MMNLHLERSKYIYIPSLLIPIYCIQTDFKNWKMKKPKIETMDFRPATSGIPFGARSSYRVIFLLSTG